MVGTGAGGGMALPRMRARGPQGDRGRRGGGHTAGRLFAAGRRDDPAALSGCRGGRTADFAIRVLMGRGVGGSTVHNTNLCKRTPARDLRAVGRRFGVVGCTAKRSWLPSSTRWSAISRSSRFPRRSATGTTASSRAGSRRSAFTAGRSQHNRVGCRESGFCELGCAYDAKQNVTKVLLPAGVRASSREAGRG